jgi:hypothetical protein
MITLGLDAPDLFGEQLKAIQSSVSSARCNLKPSSPASWIAIAG